MAVQRPVTAYRDVTIEGTSVRGDFTTTEPTEVYPHGGSVPFDTDVTRWWVRLAIADDRAHDAMFLLLGVDDGRNVIVALRGASPEGRLGALTIGQQLTGQLLPVRSLGAVVNVLDAAVEEVAEQVRAPAAGP